MSWIIVDRNNPRNTYEKTGCLIEMMRADQSKTLSSIKCSTTTFQFLFHFLGGKSWAMDYAKSMSQKKEFDKIFKDLHREIKTDQTRQDYQKVIDEVSQDLKVVYQSSEQLPEKSLGASKFPLQISYEPDALQIDSAKRRSPASSQQELKPSKYRKLDVSKENQIEQQKKNFRIPSSNRSGSSSFTITASQLLVQIRYVSTAVDIDTYEQHGYKLKKCLYTCIRKYLSENQIMMRASSPEVKIMEDIDFLKSKDAGNYRFNPFCDVLQIWIKNKNNTNFEKDFKLKGDINRLEIVLKPLNSVNWNKINIRLSNRSTIEQIVRYICNKRRSEEKDYQSLSKGLREQGGAHVAQDLYGWEKTDYSHIGIMPTYIYELMELIQQIKFSSQIQSQRQINPERELCFKIANSHKILRYLVFKLQSKAGVRKIPWVNMQNLKRAIAIVSKIIHNDELLNHLQHYFTQFALNPNGEHKIDPLAFSRGMILYGPPGTGKTVLTETLPNLIGLHLIEKGLSAANFSKSLVGETSRMITDLANRAAISPYLLCSIGIDEVDGLVPDRKDKDEKNKGEGISILLSIIGGNKNIPNLSFMTSTNYIKKIDEAISRRFDGKFQVGRPSPKQRGSIVLKSVRYLSKKKQQLDHLIRITSNFTGAALKGLATELIKILNIKETNKDPIQLSINEITQATVLIAKQFNINFGIYTLPEIYRNESEKKFIFTESFLNRIKNNFLMAQHLKDNEFKIIYANEIQKFYGGELRSIYEFIEDKISINVNRRTKFESFELYVRSMFRADEYDIISYKPQNYPSGVEQYSREISRVFNQRVFSQKQKTVLIIQDHPDMPGGITIDTRTFSRSNQNLFVIYYLPKIDTWEVGQMVYGSDRQYMKQDEFQKYVNYSGRIMIQLNKTSRMAFQLKSSHSMESKVAYKLLLKSEDATSPKTVIPEIVDFFTKQQVSYLLLIDYELMMQNSAYEEKKILQVLEEKMLEAKGYKKSAVIIDIDSMIMLGQNVSDSNLGRNISYSIHNYNIFQLLMNYMKNFASTSGDDGRWITMIVKHPELIRILKSQLCWPKNPDEIEEDLQQKALDEQRQCYRCNSFYTERENRKQRKCMQHLGKIIDLMTRTVTEYSVEQAKLQGVMRRMGKQNNNENTFLFSCCLKGLDDQGEYAYRHMTEEEMQREGDIFIENKTKFARQNSILKRLDNMPRQR